eukprot:TRINITY_DN1901_c0_g1_i6.p1 TRINITY_DN1901_c0_g1~~TRINITY_DN1901_c0_g1_i6.p1  ORF type:complete len:1664 (-),score=582.66 TRINITY_DN1901_c0_g1_i6:178-5169(-)
MASTFGPIRATAVAAAAMAASSAASSGGVGAATTPRESAQSVASSAAAAAAADARGRSTSPGQYASHNAHHSKVRQQRAGSGQRTGGLLSAWAEDGTHSVLAQSTGAPSPRTPRATSGTGGVQHATELRLSVAVADLQRQAESEKRSISRQLQQLERRVQEQLNTPTVQSRERWADLQGTVSGVLEEMAALSRRVEGLDEKLRARTAHCEEVLRNRTRELEQQFHASQHKAIMAVSTSEEMQKRHTARLRKLGTSQEEHGRRLDALEDSARHPPPTARGENYGGLIHQLDSRLQELEMRQAGFDEEVRSIVASAAHAASAERSRDASTSLDGGEQGRLGVEDYDASVQALERDMAALAKRTASQLDEHAENLANLRVRTQGQEQRIAAALDRHTAAAESGSPGGALDAFRLELQQLRDRDRQAAETRHEDVMRRLQALADAQEEASREYSDGGGLQSAQEALKRLEGLVAEQQVARNLFGRQQEQQNVPQGISPEDFTGVLVRVETLEHRVEEMEQSGLQEELLADKAERSELVRIDATVRELSDPLRRLSQRTASSEARAAALERKVEQIQGSLDSLNKSSMASGRQAAADATGPSTEAVMGLEARLEGVYKEVSSLSARVMEVESVMEPSMTMKTSGGLASQSRDDSRRPSKEVHRVVDDATLEKLDDLSRQYAEVASKVASLSQSMPEAMSGARAAADLGRQIDQMEVELKELARRRVFEDKHADSLSEALARLAGFEDAMNTMQDDTAVWKSKYEKAQDVAKDQVDALRRRVDEGYAHDPSARGRGGYNEKAEANSNLLSRRVERLENMYEELGNQIEEQAATAAKQVNILMRQQDTHHKDLSRAHDAVSLIQKKSEELVSKQAAQEGVVAEMTGSQKSAISAIEAKVNELSEKMTRTADGTAAMQDVQRTRLERMLQEVEALQESQKELKDSLGATSPKIYRASGASDSSLAVESIKKEVEELQAFRAGELKQFMQKASGGADDVSALKEEVEELQAFRAGELKQFMEKASGGAGGVSALKEEVQEIQRVLGSCKLDKKELEHLKEQIEALQKKGDDSGDESMMSVSGGIPPAVKDQIALIDGKVRELRSDHEAFKSSSKGLTDVKCKEIEKVIDRVTSGEDRTFSVQRQLEATLRTVEARLNDLIVKHEDVAAAVNNDALNKSTDSKGRGVPDEVLEKLDETSKKATAAEESATRIKGQLEEMKQQVETMRNQVAESSKPVFDPNPRGELSKQADDLRPRLASTEEAVKSVKTGVDETRALHKSLEAQLETALARMEASEAATAAVREELMCNPPSSGAALPPTVPSGDVEATSRITKDLETKVKEMCKEVTVELDELRSFERELKARKEVAKSVGSEAVLAKVPTDVSPELSNLTQQMERDLHGLAKQVANEVEALKAQQLQMQAMKEDKALAASRSEDKAVVAAVPVAAAVAPVLSSLEAAAVLEVEKQVADMAKQVDLELAALKTQQTEMLKVAAGATGSKQLCFDVERQIEGMVQEVAGELEALVRQQKELQDGKATSTGLKSQLADGLDRISSCEKATSDLSNRLDKLNETIEDACAAGGVFSSPSKVSESGRSVYVTPASKVSKLSPLDGSAAGSAAGGDGAAPAVAKAAGASASSAGEQKSGGSPVRDRGASVEEVSESFDSESSSENEE